MNEGKFKESWSLKINKQKELQWENNIQVRSKPREKRSFRTGLSSCFLWSEQLLVIETSPHSWVPAAMATLLCLCWSGQGTMGWFQGPEAFWLQIREGFCFLYIWGDFDSSVCGWVLETFLTYNKVWLKGQIFMQIAAWKESIKVFNRQITHFQSHLKFSFTCTHSYI